jgi:hypothetical protein
MMKVFVGWIEPGQNPTLKSELLLDFALKGSIQPTKEIA